MLHKLPKHPMNYRTVIRMFVSLALALMFAAVPSGSAQAFLAPYQQAQLAAAPPLRRRRRLCSKLVSSIACCPTGLR
ncbi:MAG: hypothetical protein WKF84_28145 [Pyrinomonadaceae bacterium]